MLYECVLKMMVLMLRVRLNPYSNGICSAREVRNLGSRLRFVGVLILILMEYALRAAREGKNVDYWCVLILILMEYALR